ncbi:AraC family transcriptional regulator [Inquilinus limosus]|uniref:AraC family transcriptional regulator n=1 Tax=Inquilinus limosus TaxID=171674 RepID=UPI0003F820E8|nr:AraC family transcriptional regulator [Inquilinus limosus]
MARIDRLNIAHYWRDRTVPGLNLMQADFRTREYPPHRHEALVIAVTEFGGSMIKARGVTEPATTDQALFVFNPVEPHAGWMGQSRRWLYRALYLEEAALTEVARSLGVEELTYFTRTAFADRDLVAGFLALHRALQAGRDPLLEREWLVSTFGTLFRRYGGGERRIAPGPRDRARLRAAIQIIQERLGGTISLADLGEALGLTQYQVISLFKRTTGLTPHAYVTQLRVDRASRYLAQGLPIAKVAVASGFYDQSALTKHFKRCHGITPLQFAEASRGAGAPTRRS